MNNLIDKLIILAISLALYIPSVDHIYMIIPILIVVVLTAMLSYLENDRIILGSFIAYVVICFYKPSFLFFIPLICYDVLIFRVKWVWLSGLLPLIINSAIDFNINNILICGILLVAYILKYRSISLRNIYENYYELQYDAKEISMNLEKKNKTLLEKQDYEINLATLNERNRIARDIHDNVGHMLSRSILQVGALLTISKDDNTKESLYLIKDTLTEAMDSIRSSVHDLYEESIDLRAEVQKLVDNFNFCSISFDYNIEINPDRNIKYSFISIVKEALSNIINHSNATKVSVIIREHPGLYQLIVQDNGTQVTPIGNNRPGRDPHFKYEKGIGLKNIQDRVMALNGNVNISFDKGFRIFISIPKYSHY